MSENLEPDTRSRLLADGQSEDGDGLAGRYEPGHGSRSSPVGELPTGPHIGERLPDIVAPAHTGDIVGVHYHRDGSPAVVVFFRSAVW